MSPIERKISKIDIPSYTLDQEIFNGISHFLGIPLGLAIFTIAFFLKFINGVSTSSFVGLIVFSLSLIALYLVSGLYHIESPSNTKSKKIKRVLDHCTIYVLIAGTYTPICLYLSDISSIGIVLLIIEWSLAAIGVILNIIDFTNRLVKGISMFLYLALGWLILFSGAFTSLPTLPFIFVLIGGILYTIGSVLYGIGHKNLYFHSVFHIFVLLGSIFQAIGVILLYM